MEVLLVEGGGRSKAWKSCWRRAGALVSRSPTIYRFDDRMIVTPFLYRARGFEHPALQLRRLSPFGMFERYAAQFEDVWATVRPVT